MSTAKFSLQISFNTWHGGEDEEVLEQAIEETLDEHLYGKLAKKDEELADCMFNVAIIKR